MAISKYKKRYNVTLTPARVERFQALCKRLGLPVSTMSDAFDDTLTSLSDTFQIAADQGASGITDIVAMMGKQMELMEQEKEKYEDKQKRNPDTR